MTSDAVSPIFFPSSVPIIRSVGKGCSLTLARPDGKSRTYTTDIVFARQKDAKNAVATIAVDAGVLDFIAFGDDSLVGQQDATLEPEKPQQSAQAEDRTQPPTYPALDHDLEGGAEAVQEIDNSCRKYHVKKQTWIPTTTTKVNAGMFVSFHLLGRSLTFLSQCTVVP